MNNNIPIYWRPHLANIESRTDWIVVIVHTNVPEPHTASCLLILLHSFAASGIDQSQPAGRDVAPQHTTSYFLPIAHRLFAILLYTFLLFLEPVHVHPAVSLLSSTIIINIVVVTNYVSFWFFFSPSCSPLFGF